MGDIDEMDLEDVEQRLEDLRKKKAALDELHDHVDEARENLLAIRDHHLVDDELAAKVDLILAMVDWTMHDVHVGKAISYERDQLRQRKWELEREGDDD